MQEKDEPLQGNEPAKPVRVTRRLGEEGRRTAVEAPKRLLARIEAEDGDAPSEPDTPPQEASNTPAFTPSKADRSSGDPVANAIREETLNLLRSIEERGGFPAHAKRPLTRRDQQSDQQASPPDTSLSKGS